MELLLTGLQMKHIHTFVPELNLILPFYSETFIVEN